MYQATADRVLLYFRPTTPAYRSREEQQWLGEIDELAKDPELAAQAREALEWAKGLEPGEDNDYLYNVNLIARAGFVNHKSAGLAASIIAAWKRARDKELEMKKAAARPVSQHVGTLKQRATMTLTCERIFESEGQYGVTGIHRLRDEAGNLLVWFASGSTEWMKEGETASVKATIVSHDEYRGEKQTRVNCLVKA